jgi:hypothetical protein
MRPTVPALSHAGRIGKTVCSHVRGGAIHCVMASGARAGVANLVTAMAVSVISLIRTVSHAANVHRILPQSLVACNASTRSMSAFPVHRLRRRVSAITPPDQPSRTAEPSPALPRLALRPDLADRRIGCRHPCWRLHCRRRLLGPDGGRKAGSAGPSSVRDR